MRRIASLLLIGAMTMTLPACGGKPKIDDALIAKYIRHIGA
jgi:hypothetical protein